MRHELDSLPNLDRSVNMILTIRQALVGGFSCIGLKQNGRRRGGTVSALSGRAHN
nr:hypothetical protein [Kibdelosporangium sp. MJ126-NF4]CTQ90396.1 hypothetical protein [Kibdelosporangium sp. MJ126-NF4]